MKIKITILWALFLILVSFPGAEARQVELRLLYVNDFHGFALPYKPLGAEGPVGGAAYLATAVEKLRREKPTLLLAAGDMIQGNNWVNLFRGASAIELMNAMKFDAMAAGNHEFDFGLEILRQRLSEARFPVLAANVEGMPQLKPYVIKKVAGLRVAIIGLVTEDTPIATHPRNVSDLKFLEPEKTVEKYREILSKQADFFIILAHLGHQRERQLAQRVKGIPVIIGGHSHTKVLEPAVVGDTLVVQAWEHAKALGVLDLTVKDGKIVKYQGRLEEIKPVHGQENPAVQRIVAAYAWKVDAQMNVPVAEAQVDLDGERVRTKETNLGNLIADIMRETARAQVALTNGGGIRASIPKGQVKVKEVYTTLPFDNYLVAISLTGRQLKEALEHGVSSLEEPAGRFPQVSGLSFTYSRAAPVGSRVKEVLVQGQPLAPEKEYTVATNDFLAAGGDGYAGFGEAIKAASDFSEQGGLLKSSKITYSDAGRWLRDVVIESLRARKKISAQVEGRIKEVP
ncbi:MAG: bifunctional metallophosphatase/5'-nucleotidase [Deltaproteobacteria bacterium]|nr:bifunctional metallophosphatase/5'-nucleotidase [Deltaproteobacteria bacterium]